MPNGNPETISPDLAAAHAMLTAAVATLREEINALNDAIGADKGEIARLREIPVSLDDFSQFLRHEIDTRGREWLGQGGNILSVRSGEQKSNALPWSRFESKEGELLSAGIFGDFNTPGVMHRSSNAAFDAFCYFFPDQVHDKLMASYRATAGGKWGNTEHPSVADRRTAVATLLARIEANTTRRNAKTAEFEQLTGAVVINLDPPNMPLKGGRLVNPDLQS